MILFNLHDDGRGEVDRYYATLIEAVAYAVECRDSENVDMVIEQVEVRPHGKANVCAMLNGEQFIYDRRQVATVKAFKLDDDERERFWLNDGDDKEALIEALHAEGRYTGAEFETKRKARKAKSL